MQIAKLCGVRSRNGMAHGSVKFSKDLHVNQLHMLVFHVHAPD